jgi:ParB-like chromosome segregation protein Spo0J
MMTIAEDTAWRGEGLADLRISRIHTRYETFRLVCPRAEAVMMRSVKRYGQLTPVVVGRSTSKSRHELVDGFKRVRALRKLGRTAVNARILEGGERVQKAAIVLLNRPMRAITAMEEAMVVHSLYRENGLTQEEISVLFGRHKSWACRRIALKERLSEDVHEHLRLRLVGVGIGRELARLPRGNQEGVLRAVLEHRLTRRETGRLVSLLLSRPRWEHEALLRFPRETIEDKRTGRDDETDPEVQLCQAVETIQEGCDVFAKCLARYELTTLSSTRLLLVSRKLEGAERRISELRALIQENVDGSGLHPQS